MNGERMRALQAKGYRIGAQKTGLPHDLYRPTSALQPLAAANKLLSLPVAWKPASPGDSFKGANLYGKPTWYGYFDFTLTKVGDYLVRQEDQATWFVVAQQHLLQPAAVDCNAVISITRPGQANEGFGAVGYGNADPGRPVITGWPCSMLAGTKGEKSDDGLPRDTRNPWYAILLPALPGIEIRTDDKVSDARGYNYEVSSAELTDLGWRLSVMFTGT